MTTMEQNHLHDLGSLEQNERNLRRVVEQNERKNNSFLKALFRVATVVGALFVIIGIFNIVFAMGGGGSMMMAKYLLMAGGVIVVVAQMLYRV